MCGCVGVYLLMEQRLLPEKSTQSPNSKMS